VLSGFALLGSSSVASSANNLRCVGAAGSRTRPGTTSLRALAWACIAACRVRALADAEAFAAALRERPRRSSHSRLLFRLDPDSKMVDDDQRDLAVANDDAGTVSALLNDCLDWWSAFTTACDPRGVTRVASHVAYFVLKIPRRHESGEGQWIPLLHP
jgi:hypothetical protein